MTEDRLRRLVAVALLGASSFGATAHANTLDAERWRTRPLVIVVPTADDPLLTGLEAALGEDDAQAGFAEREMVLFKVVGGQGSRDGRPLTPVETRQLLDAVGSTAGAPATVFLVGKDGEVKVTERREASLRRLFETIDRMPMRAR